MFIQPPEGIVARIKANIKLGKIDLRNKDINIILASQPGMLQGRNEFELVGVPAELQEGGAPLGSSANAASGISPAGEGQSHKLDHLVIVLDTSGSMNTPDKLGHIQERLKALKPFVPIGTKVSLVTFDSDAKVRLSCEGNLDKAVDYVSALKADGSYTNIHAGIVEANQEFGKIPDYDINNPGRSLCLFITDGQHNKGPSGTPDIFKAVDKLTHLRNCPIVTVGVGTDYSTDVIKGMAGNAVSGAWVHTSAQNTQLDVFGKVIPDLIKQITGNDSFIRIDCRGANRIWSCSPSVQELGFLTRNITYPDPDENTYKAVFGGYWSEPTLVAISPETVREWLEFRIAGQKDSRVNADNPDDRKIPTETGEVMPIIDFDELLPADRERANKEFLKWIVAVTLQERDLKGLEMLQKAGIIPQDLFEKVQNSFSNIGDEDQSRSLVSSMSVFDLSHRSIGPLESQIMQSQVGPSISRISSGDSKNSIDLQQALEELERLAELERSNPGQSEQALSDIQSQDRNPSQLFSGVLGPLDSSPVDSNLPVISGPIGPNAARAYDFQFNIENVRKLVGVKTYFKNPIVLNESKPLIFGRAPGCDVETTDTRASRRHCSVTLENGKPFIADLGSSNGTFVNGVRIGQKQELKDGDQVTVGTWIFKVKF